MPQRDAPVLKIRCCFRSVPYDTEPFVDFMAWMHAFVPGRPMMLARGRAGYGRMKRIGHRISKAKRQGIMAGSC